MPRVSYPFDLRRAVPRLAGAVFLCLGGGGAGTIGGNSGFTFQSGQYIIKNRNSMCGGWSRLLDRTG